MLSIDNILETNQMIHDNKLDVRTITMGISLLECASSSGKELCDRIYDRITKEAEHLVSTDHAYFFLNCRTLLHCLRRNKILRYSYQKRARSGSLPSRLRARKLPSPGMTLLLVLHLPSSL